MGIFDRKKSPAKTSPELAPAPVSPDVSESVTAPTGDHSFGSTSTPISTSTPSPEPSATPVRYGVPEWRDHIRELVSQVPPSGVQLLDAIGLTLAETLVSDLDLPVASTATTTGYAIRCEDTLGATPMSPVGLKVWAVESDPDVKPGDLPPVSAMRVTVGSPLPVGADTVVPATEVEISSQLLIIVHEATPGNHIKPQGSDLSEGTTLAVAGTTLTPKLIGLIAETGFDKILVSMRPRVVVINFASHTVEPGYPLLKVRERYASATVQVAAAAKADGADVFVLNSPLSDAHLAEQLLFDQLIRADLIVTVGGTEPGGLISKIPHGSSAMSTVTLQDADRQGFTQIGENRTPWVMIPGDLVTSRHSYELFVRPVIRKLAGHDHDLPESIPVSAQTAFESPADYTQCLPAEVSDGKARVLGDPNRPVPLDYLNANAMIVVPADVERIAAGQSVECLMQ